MNYEQKYKVALERANIIYTGKYKPEIAAWTKKTLEAIFPELKESEDGINMGAEEIREGLCEFLHCTTDEYLFETFGIHQKDAIAWLEKQGKQKPIGWSEEDECYMSECISAIATKDNWTFEEKRKTKHWLESLKHRLEEQQ